jgi:IQ domain-containing protein G
MISLQQVSKDLKTSTRKLCRQLQDNPDVGGNQQLIKKYKSELGDQLNNLMVEMAKNQTYTSFKKKIDKETEDQNEYDDLRNREKELNNDIKKINEDLKKKQDDFALEAQESSDEIAT